MTIKFNRISANIKENYTIELVETWKKIKINANIKIFL